MKKENQAKIIVKRVNSSPYFINNFHHMEKSSLESLPNVFIWDKNTGDNDPPQILITNTHTDLSLMKKEELDACQLMIHPNSGYDNFNFEFIKNASFPIVLGNSIRSNAVTNYILSALFSHYAKIPNESSWNSLRTWPRKLLSEATILIIGLGFIGSLLHKSLAPLAKSIRIFDPYKGHPDLNYKNVDILITTCSLNLYNHHLINHSSLNQLNQDFLFINAARGGLVNTNDLLAVLKARPLAFAVLDVFEKEPADFFDLKKTPNLLLTSHLAGVYKNIDQETIHFETKTISDFINLSKNEFENEYRDLLLKNRLHSDHFLI